ncbi:MAG: phosphatase PAP2 family protein [Planctomycetaceae bacterium]|nr:phosphatase PAP2 family protein [Planctomycetaceae bacterium]MBT6487274.1 phosphatase PAP2 family protein [Planctomycetaceae bacterium]
MMRIPSRICRTCWQPIPSTGRRLRCAIWQAVILLFILPGVSATATLKADEIDDVFNQPLPAVYERETGEVEATIEPVAATFVQPSSHGFQSGLQDFLPMLRDDTRAIVNWNNAAILGGALATSIALRQDVDDRVRNNTARHPERWGQGSKTLGNLGEVQYHVAAMLVLYGVSVKRGDDELHDFSSALISAYTINGLSTLAMKGIANTSRPSDDWNGGAFGFPSFHSSSSFTIAAVVDEYYGPKAGLPAYALAGLISWSRLDERDHDLSDVVFGAALGYVIGHAVAGQHLRCDSRVRLLPYFHPTEGTGGLMVDVSF